MDWSALDYIGMDWRVLEWIGLDCNDGSGAGRGAKQIRKNWNSLDWNGLDWAEWMGMD